MAELIKTNAANPDFIQLVKLLDAYLAVTDGDEHDFYDRYNKTDGLKHVIVAYENGLPVACGAMKEYDPQRMEIKRMYTLPANRGTGMAGKILVELENWAKELSYKKCLLETGKRQHEAIALYHKKGYSVIDNYGQYTGVANSVCFEKAL